MVALPAKMYSFASCEFLNIGHLVAELVDGACVAAWFLPSPIRTSLTIEGRSADLDASLLKAVVECVAELLGIFV